MSTQRIILVCGPRKEPTHLVVVEGLRIYIVPGDDPCVDLPIQWEDEAYLDYRSAHAVSVIVGRLQRDEDGSFLDDLRRRAEVEKVKRS